MCIMQHLRSIMHFNKNQYYCPFQIVLRPKGYEHFVQRYLGLTSIGIRILHMCEKSGLTAVLPSAVSRIDGFKKGKWQIMFSTLRRTHKAV